MISMRPTSPAPCECTPLLPEGQLLSRSPRYSQKVGRPCPPHTVFHGKETCHDNHPMHDHVFLKHAPYPHRPTQGGGAVIREKSRRWERLLFRPPGRSWKSRTLLTQPRSRSTIPVSCSVHNYRSLKRGKRQSQLGLYEVLGSAKARWLTIQLKRILVAHVK